jgi:hypothetical protein
MKHWKLILLATLLVIPVLSSSLFGEEQTGWVKTLDLTFNVTQSSYSENWAGGEQGNATWIAQANGIFEKQFSPRFNSKTTIKLAFGQTHTQYEDKNTETGVSTYKWAKPVKSTDKIDIESVGRFTFGWFVDPYAAVRFESQFLDASVEHHKRYLNPKLVTLSSGFARKIWHRPEKDELISRLGLAIRELISEDIPDPDVDKTETNTATDGGFESVTDFSIIFSERVGLLSKLSLFKALFNSRKDDLKGLPEEDYWKAVDVNLENTLTVSVAKYLQVSLYTQLQYDKEIDLGGRFKETLSLGLTYKML